MSATTCDLVRQRFQAGVELKRRVADAFAPMIVEAAEGIRRRLSRGGTIFTCGNGGSAADAQHMAAELAGRFLREREPLPAVCLNTNPSTLTAIGNDYGFEEVFSRPLAGLARESDVLVALSTSGDSLNVVRALEVARERGLYRVGLTGESGGSMKALCDLCFCVPSGDTPRVQEVHITVVHILCELVEAEARD